jgi:hypothetical protein
LPAGGPAVDPACAGCGGGDAIEFRGDAIVATEGLRVGLKRTAERLSAQFPHSPPGCRYILPQALGFPSLTHLQLARFVLFVFVSIQRPTIQRHKGVANWRQRLRSNARVGTRDRLKTRELKSPCCLTLSMNVRDEGVSSCFFCVPCPFPKSLRRARDVAGKGRHMLRSCQ